MKTALLLMMTALLPTLAYAKPAKIHNIALLNFVSEVVYESFPDYSIIFEGEIPDFRKSTVKYHDGIRCTRSSPERYHYGISHRYQCNVPTLLDAGRVHIMGRPAQIFFDYLKSKVGEKVTVQGIGTISLEEFRGKILAKRDDHPRSASLNVIICAEKWRASRRELEKAPLTGLEGPFCYMRLDNQPPF